MTGHTAGPWTARKASVGANYWYVYSEGQSPGGEDSITIADCLDTAADANLIAAAPLLLEALKEAREEIVEMLHNRGGYGEDEHKDFPIIAKIDSAIAAATRSET